MPANPSGTGDEIVAHRIQRRRTSLELSQERLASALQELLPDDAITQSYISQVENVRTWMSARRLRAFATALQTTVAYLMGETDEPRTPEARLRAMGISRGNVSSETAEALQALIVDAAEALQREGRVDEGVGSRLDDEDDTDDSRNSRKRLAR